MYLNCHSYYSLRYGTFSETGLLDLCDKNAVNYVALTDINSTSACMNFLKEAEGFSIHPLIGVDVRNGVEPLYVLLAKNNAGFLQLNEFLSTYIHKKEAFPTCPPFLNDCFVIYPFGQVLTQEKKDFESNEFVGISIADLRRLPFCPIKDHKDRLVIQQTVSFRDKKDFNAHRLLRCIDLNTLLSKLPKAEQGSPDQKMHPLKNLMGHFSDYPHIIENTERIMSQCRVKFGFGEHRANQNQTAYFDTEEEDFDYLKKLCQDRIGLRYPVVDKIVGDRLKKELDAIKSMDFVGYFLMNYDIVRYARSKDFPYIGRGSGANSMVAYILGITNVDPIALDLYFERFINIYRTSPPDFDIDFSWKDRDDVTQYIFKRFPNCALMGTYVTFQYRAMVRELSKVFGIPKHETDNFLNGRKSVESSTDKYMRLVQKYGQLIHGFPNYLSVHSGGILITQNPVHYYGGTFLPPKGFPTVQFDMNIAEEVGIFKFDILAQRGLSKIKDAIEIIAVNQPDAEVEDIDNVHRLTSDPILNAKLTTGDCMGVFYAESPAMRGLMTKLRTHDYIGLVAASSIIRPGVGNGGMKNEFILRERFPERRKQAHPVLAKILHETHGVMVYQEDVLKVAHLFAGLSLAEADVLRRGMRGKVSSKGQFEKMEQKFKQNCLDKGYGQEQTTSVWEQVKAFAGYAFAKGHSASYAVESYQSLYLKEYFPLEYLTAILNNGGGFYNVETYLNEVRKKGGTVELPCINTSDHPNSIIGRTIYLGLGMIKDLESRTAQKILTERQLNGPYQNLSNFTDRLQIGLEQLVLLIRVGGFRFTGIDKKNLLWEAHFIEDRDKRKSIEPVLFNERTISYSVPEFRSGTIEDSYDEIELLGFPVRSRFQMLKGQLPKSPLAKDLPDNVGKQISIYGTVVTAKRVPLENGKTMYFGTFLDQFGDFFDTVHFPNSVSKSFMTGKEVYMIHGTVTDELGYYSITVDWVKPVEREADPRYFGVGVSHKVIT